MEAPHWSPLLVVRGLATADSAVEAGLDFGRMMKAAKTLRELPALKFVIETQAQTLTFGL